MTRTKLSNCNRFSPLTLHKRNLPDASSISRIEREDGGSSEGCFSGSRDYCTRGVQLAASARMRAVNGCLNRNNRAYAQWREPQRTRHLTERTIPRMRKRAWYLILYVYRKVRATTSLDSSSDPTFNCDLQSFSSLRTIGYHKRTKCVDQFH